MIVAGFDEAGYGPRLGPLVIGWTAFEVEEGGSDDLWERLEEGVRREGRGPAHKVWVADSKVIKPRKNGVKNLELGALGFLRAAGIEVGSLSELLQVLGQPTDGWAAWYGDLSEHTLPRHAWSGEIATRGERLREVGATSGTRFVGARARVVPAQQLNALISETPNKGAVLGDLWVELMKELRTQHEGPIRVTCDKQGGRADYRRLLMRALPGGAISIVEQSPGRSAYRVKTAQGLVEIEFRVQADGTSLPVALASMVCKYLREQGMERFNAWFQERVPGLKATAGYAKDAGRFLRDVQGQLEALNVSTKELIRAR